MAQAQEQKQPRDRANETPKAEVREASAKQPPRDGAPADALRGPDVGVQAAKTTLVERDFEGKLRRLEAPPEEAALDLLDLSEDAWSKVETILQERAAILDRVVIENIDLLLKAQTAKSASDQRGLKEVADAFTAKLAGLRNRGKLVHEIAEALPTDQAGRYRSLVKEYHTAVYREMRKEAEAKGESLKPREIIARQVAQGFGQEIKRSYDRQIASRTGEFEELLKVLEFTPEQESKIRKIAQEFGQKTKLNPNASDKRAVFREVMKELTLAQKAKALKHVLAERR